MDKAIKTYLKSFLFLLSELKLMNSGGVLWLGFTCVRDFYIFFNCFSCENLIRLEEK